MSNNSAFTNGNGQRSRGVQKSNPSFEDIVVELVAYGKEHELHGLEGRSVRGLDPAGLLAVNVTRGKVIVLAEALGARIDDVENFTERLHTNGPWQDVDALSEGERPEVCVWIVMGEITIRGRDKEKI